MKIDLLRNGVNVIGYFQGQFGLGETARSFVAALESASIPHSLISADFLIPTHNKITDRTYICEETGKYPINIFCTNDDAIIEFIKRKGLKQIKNHYNICLCFWETSNFPKERLPCVKALDEVWVCSHYIHEILSSEINIPVNHIPHPLHFNFKQGAPNKKAFGLDDKFTFLFCFDFHSVSERKNPKATINAFQKAFQGRNDVQLVIKSQHGHLHSHQYQSALELIKNDSRITWIDGSMEKNKRDELMNSCDCYVSLHRSEGFGLTMAEAMLFEKPVIATEYSGNLDFMNQQNSFLCGYKLISVGLGSPPYPPGGLWADVEIDEAAHWMNYIVNNRREAQLKAARGKNDILQNHSFERVGSVVQKRITDISAKLNSKWAFLKPSNLYFHYTIQHVILRYPRAIVKRLKRQIKQIFKLFSTVKN